MKSNNLGTLFDDHDEVVVFSLDEVQTLSEQLNMTIPELIEQYGGVRCPLEEGIGHSVNKVHAVLNDGNVVDIALIGGDPQLIARFLEPNEQSFEEFLRSHPDYPIVGFGEFYNETLFQEIRQQYLQQVGNVP